MDIYDRHGRPIEPDDPPERNLSMYLFVHLDVSFVGRESSFEHHKKDHIVPLSGEGNICQPFVSAPIKPGKMMELPLEFIAQVDLLLVRFKVVPERLSPDLEWEIKYLYDEFFTPQVIDLLAARIRSRHDRGLAGELYTIALYRYWITQDEEGDMNSNFEFLGLLDKVEPTLRGPVLVLSKEV